MAKTPKRAPVKKSARSSTHSPERAPARAKSATPEAGPVTLDEARALAQPRQVKRTAAKMATPPTSPEAVGEERAKLEKKRREEIDRRIQEYTQTMAIMTQRGARAPEPKGGGKGKRGAVAAKAVGFRPLQIFAEGDSWFDYPVPFFGGGIIPRLERRLGVPILNLAKAGDEVRAMLGVEERKILTKQLKAGCPSGGQWDVLLFSGGGNDIVDNPMVLWVRDWDPAIPPAQHVNQPRFNAALALVRAGYEDLIELRNQLSPTTQLVLHAYDFAIPDGRGVCFFGPWLKPTFDLRKFPNRAAMAAVVRSMLEQFAAMLTALAALPGVTFINGQGTLPAQTSSWDNELHPSAAGFDKFANLFRQQLQVLFPDRVA